MSVGHSSRTAIKHAYLDRTVGADIGAARYCAPKLWPRTPYQRHVLVDLTAGDGASYHDGEWWRTCSPGIMAYHGQHEKCPVPVEILLCEQTRATFAQLVITLGKRLPLLGYRQVTEQDWEARNGRVQLTTRLGDSRAMPCPWSRGDFVFLNNDPNNMHGWAMPSDLDGAVDRGAVVRSFSTMGANAEGIKRLPLDGAREGWFGHIERVTSALRQTQDATLLAIDGDSSQWAYHVVTPAKWAKDDAARARKLFAEHGAAVTAASFRSEPDRYRQLLDRLFLTDKERRPDVPLEGWEG